MRSYLLPLVVLAACSDGGTSSDPAELVAGWRRVPASFDADKPLDQRTLVTFGADGSYMMDERHGDPVEVGTYTADDLAVTVNAPASGSNPATTFVEQYAVLGSRMMLAPLRAVGSVDGVVGKWHGVVELRSSTGTSMYTDDVTLNADGTSHSTGVGIGGPFTFDGTWTEADGEVKVQFTTQGVNVTTHMQKLAGIDDVLGGDLFEKL